MTLSSNKKVQVLAKVWKEPKVAKYSKGVQVYEDVLKEKYKWKKEFSTKLVQTDDIILEQLARDQHEFRKTRAFQRYF